ncbi:hypothetical protein CHUV0807_0045 [Cardiobacterium hominis]|uniref:Uncharacterized protein n=1 Tax=Cardiobacterium hominis TaxID=2718 RepID=A0A1C3H1N8_9GAMM|nr:hypothetical protein CHUV0807_0045 [Cardiobacterium hominis]
MNLRWRQVVTGCHFRDVVLPAFARCAVLHGSVTRRVARMPTADIRQTKRLCNPPGHSGATQSGQQE